LHCSTLLAVGQQVAQLNPAVGADAFVGDLVVIEEFDQRWSAHPEQIRGLLGGQHHCLRDDGHRQALAHGFDDLLQHLVDLGRDLDLFARGGTGQKVPGPGGLVVGRRCAEQLKDLRQSFRVHAGKERLPFQSCRVHRPHLPSRMKRNRVSNLADGRWFCRSLMHPRAPCNRPCQPVAGCMVGSLPPAHL
jgi:hypothetical protein